MTMNKSNYWDIEVSPKMYDIISEMFQMLGFTAPTSITHSEMEKISQQMKVIFKTQTKNIYQSNFKIHDSKLKPEHIVKATDKVSKALVISNLGIVRYQLKNLLSHKKIETKTSESLYVGLAEYVKKLQDLVIIDINGNYEETIDVIDEIKRISRENNVKTRIVILAPALKNNEKLKFLTRGVTKYIEKHLSWYQEFVHYFSNLTENALVK